MDSGVITSIIVAVGGIITAFISVRFRSKKPKSEYIDTAFQMYESLIKQKDAENLQLREDKALLTRENGELMLENNRLKRRRG